MHFAYIHAQTYTYSLIVQTLFYLFIAICVSSPLYDMLKVVVVEGGFQ